MESCEDLLISKNAALLRSIGEDRVHPIRLELFPQAMFISYRLSWEQLCVKLVDKTGIEPLTSQM